MTTSIAYQIFPNRSKFTKNGKRRIQAQLKL